MQRFSNSAWGVWISFWGGGCLYVFVFVYFGLFCILLWQSEIAKLTLRALYIYQSLLWGKICYFKKFFFCKLTLTYKSMHPNAHLNYRHCALSQQFLVVFYILIFFQGNISRPLMFATPARWPEVLTFISPLYIVSGNHNKYI